MKKAKQEDGLNPKNKRLIREDRRIDTAKAKTPKLNSRLRDYKAGKDMIVKALADTGHRESALLLKNWDEMDSNAESMEKSITKFIKEDLAKPGGTGLSEKTGAGISNSFKTGAPSGGKISGAISDAWEGTKEMAGDAYDAVSSLFSKDEFNDKKVEAKKKQYKDINKPMPDPFEENLKIAKPKKIKKVEDTMGDVKNDQIDKMKNLAGQPTDAQKIGTAISDAASTVGDWFSSDD